MHVLVWEKVLRRMSPAGHLPEGRLLCSVIANAINDEPAEVVQLQRMGMEEVRPFEGRFWELSFGRFCRSLALDPQQVMGMVQAVQKAEAAGLKASTVADMDWMQLREIREWVRSGGLLPACLRRDDEASLAGVAHAA